MYEFKQFSNLPSLDLTLFIKLTLSKVHKFKERQNYSVIIHKRITYNNNTITNLPEYFTHPGLPQYDWVSTKVRLTSLGNSLTPSPTTVIQGVTFLFLSAGCQHKQPLYGRHITCVMRPPARHETATAGEAPETTHFINLERGWGQERLSPSCGHGMKDYPGETWAHLIFPNWTWPGVSTETSWPRFLTADVRAAVEWLLHSLWLLHWIQEGGRDGGGARARGRQNREE